MLNAAPLSLTGGRPDTVGLVLISSDFANNGMVECCLQIKCINDIIKDSRVLFFVFTFFE